jgi:hypothetical protein
VKYFRIILLTSLFGCSSVCFAETSLCFEKESYEFGGVDVFDVIETTIYLTNGTPETVIINRLRSSCGCTMILEDLKDSSIGPGQNFPIKISVEKSGSGGVSYQTSSIAVYTDKGFCSTKICVQYKKPPGFFPLEETFVYLGRKQHRSQIKSLQKEIYFTPNGADVSLLEPNLVVNYNTNQLAVLGGEDPKLDEFGSYFWNLTFSPTVEWQLGKFEEEVEFSVFYEGKTHKLKCRVFGEVY